MIRLFIADDHSIVREGLKHVIAMCRDMLLVGEAEDAEEALKKLRQTPADVILLDVGMPGPGVLEVIRRVKALHAQCRVLVLSVHPEEHYARRVLKAGADGYLTKTHSAQALPSAIRQIHHGRKYVSPTFAEELALDVARGREIQPHEALSNREYEVFLSLGAGHSVDHVAQALNISPKTVRTYRSRILEKANLHSTAELIFYAVHHGLVTDVTKDHDPDARE